MTNYKFMPQGDRRDSSHLFGKLFDENSYSITRKDNSSGDHSQI